VFGCFVQQTIEQNSRTHTSHVKLLNKTTELTPTKSNYGTKQPNTHLPRQTIIVLRGRCVFGSFVQKFDVGGVCSIVLFNSLKWEGTTEHTPLTSNY
jgi:hypothetical protein